MRPYYQDSLTTIYHGDAREIVPTLDWSDICLTDPPYGLPGEDPNIAAEVLTFTPYRVAAVFSDWRSSIALSAVPAKVGELVWEYGWVSGGRTRAKFGAFPTHNTIHLFGDRKRLHLLDGSIIRRQPGFSSPRQCSYARKSGHPYEKPVKLVEWLLAHLDGFTAVDPFMGSGTTLVAAKRRRTVAVGIEVEERWCEVAARRLEEEQPEVPA